MRFFGTEEWIVRLLPVLLGTAGVYVFYRILKKLDFSGYPLAISCLMLASSPLHIYYSHENRMYILAGLGFLLVFYFFLNYLKKQSKQNFVGLSLSLVLMGFSHYLTLFVVPVLLVYGYLKLNRKIFYPFILLLICYLVYSPILLEQLKVGIDWQNRFPVWQSTVGGFSLKTGLLFPLKFIIGRISWQPQWFYFISGGLLILGFWGTALAGAADSWLTASLLFIPPAIGFIISPWISVFSYFRFFYLLPLFYLSIGFSKSKLKKKTFKLITLGLVGVNIFCSAVYLFNSNFHRENWRGMVNWLHQENQSDSLVIILSQINKPFNYYDQNKSNVYNISDPVKANLDQRMNKYDQVYLVSYGLPIFDPNDKIREELRDNGLKLKTGESFNKVGVEVWRD